MLRGTIASFFSVKPPEKNKTVDASVLNCFSYPDLLRWLLEIQVDNSDFFPN